jgi:thiol:disulfide interchange protein DsbC
MKKVLETRKDIVFHVVMFPLRIHPEAYVKSKAIICEKSIKLLEDAYDRKHSLGITSTPALVFQDGRKASGAMKAEALIKLIDNN